MRTTIWYCCAHVVWCTMPKIEDHFHSLPCHMSNLLTILLIMQDNHSVVSSSCRCLLQPPQPPPPPAAPAATTSSCCLLQPSPPPAAASEVCRLVDTNLRQSSQRSAHFNMTVQNNLPRLSPQRLSHCLSVSKLSLPGRYSTYGL